MPSARNQGTHGKQRSRVCCLRIACVNHARTLGERTRDPAAKSISTHGENVFQAGYRANIVPWWVTVLPICRPRSLTLFRATSHAGHTGLCLPGVPKGTSSPRSRGGRSFELWRCSTYDRCIFYGTCRYFVFSHFCRFSRRISRHVERDCLERSERSWRRAGFASRDAFDRFVNQEVGFFFLIDSIIHGVRSATLRICLDRKIR